MGLRRTTGFAMTAGVQSTLSNLCRSPRLSVHALRSDAGDRQPPVPTVVMCLSYDAMSDVRCPMSCDVRCGATFDAERRSMSNAVRCLRRDAMRQIPANPHGQHQRRESKPGSCKPSVYIIYPRNLGTLLRGPNNPFSITVPSIFSGYPPTS